MNFFERSLNYNGYDIASAKLELKRIQAIPEEVFEDYIEDQKRFILTHHLLYTPFYKKIINKKAILEWDEVPVMIKKDLQQPLSKRLAEGYVKQQVYIGKTSGSSGTPFTFAKCKASHALSWASFYDRYNWYGIDVGSSRQARFYGIPLHIKGYLKERLKDWIGNRYRFPIFNLNDHKLERILRRFKNQSFTYINGYTSSIVLFARFLQQKKIVLSQVCTTLKICIVTSEMLYEDDRAFLEKQLGVDVINEYGASETGLIAFQNPEGELQVDSELLYIEILDENNVSVPPGRTGRIVITSFYNKAHPIIRYDIGDRGALSKSSTYKRPILKVIEGRTSDVAHLPSGKVVPGLTFYYVTKTVIQDSNNVTEFVIEQTLKDTFLITYVAREELNSQERASIRKSVITYLEKGLNVQFKRVHHLQRSKSGKLKQFTSKVL